MTDHLTKTQATAWANEMATSGTGGTRHSYLAQFGAGAVAKRFWDDPTFTLGVEYGIRIAVAKIFGELSE